MSFGTVISFGFGILSPLALVVACIFEFIARRMAKGKKPDTALLQKRQTVADACLIAAWILLALAYVCFRFLPTDKDVWQAAFQNWMTWCIYALVALDIVYLYIRRARPRKEGEKKRFWEV